MPLAALCSSASRYFPILMAVSLSACAAAPQLEAGPAPVSELVAKVDIPYEMFRLDNGLTAIVHEDRKAPLVAVSIWYGVGSKHEPEGKTGYAHLFEHIMFNGSENAPDDYFSYLKQIGATSYNGSTWFDRTNYYETVPRTALESALFLESDRMGNLLGAVTQAKLDNQIAVVQNEKRQGDNNPYGLFDYEQIRLLFPEDHPYGHPTIGSMSDLSAASLQDMYDWFEGHYGPNNAVLVLAGDISAAEARPLVKKWFGRFASGPQIAELAPELPTRDEPAKVIMHDDVPNTRISYSWAVPGLNDPSNAPLSVAARVLGGLLSSRLDNILVRDEQLAVSVRAVLQSFQNASIFEVSADVKDGVDPDLVASRLDQIMGDYIANGPTEAEVARVATDSTASTIAGLEKLAGKAAELATGQLYSNDPAFYKSSLEQLAATSPEDVRDAMQRWLTRPRVEIRVVPGERQPGEGGPYAAEAKGALSSPSYYRETGAASPELATDRLAKASDPQVVTDGEVGTDTLNIFPLPSETVDLDFPDVVTTELSNGVPVHYVNRPGVPIMRVVAQYDGGYSADPDGGEGTAAFATRVMLEGTASRNSTELAEEQERLGAELFGYSTLEQSEFGIRTVSPNLDSAVALLADVLRNPAFDAAEVERVRAQQLSSIAAEYSEPSSLAFRALPPVLYGEGHPYGVPFSGSGYADVVEKLSQDDLAAFHTRWIRPDNMRLYVIGDISLEQAKPVLERHLGSWGNPNVAAGVVPTDADIVENTARIIVYDRPKSPQSYVMAGQVLSTKGTDELAAVNLANDVLGGDFLSRINMDLREDKGWSYGARSAVIRPKGYVPFVAYAPVQADQTGPALQELRKLIRGIKGDQPISADERDRVVNAAILQLPGQFETSLSILSQVQADVKYGRPSDYAEGAADRYRALSADDLNAALPPLLRPDEMVWIIVGDADIVRPQLQGIDLPVEYRSLDQSRGE